MAFIDFATKYIYNTATSFTETVANSLTYRVCEIERHFHSYERRIGLAASPSGETHVCDRVITGVSPFTLTAGASDFGNWVQLVGSTDVNAVIWPLGGVVYHDPHKVVFTAASNTSLVYVVQVV